MKIQIAVVLFLSLAGQSVFAAGDVQRGRELHNENCVTCHVNVVGGDGTGIYTRADRKIDSYEGLENQVMRCKTSLGVPWPDHQIEDVLTYLNELFYHFEK